MDFRGSGFRRRVDGRVGGCGGTGNGVDAANKVAGAIVGQFGSPRAVSHRLEENSASGHVAMKDGVGGPLVEEAECASDVRDEGENLALPEGSLTQRHSERCGHELCDDDGVGAKRGTHKLDQVGMAGPEREVHGHDVPFDGVLVEYAVLEAPGCHVEAPERRHARRGPQVACYLSRCELQLVLGHQPQLLQHLHVLEGHLFVERRAPVWGYAHGRWRLFASILQFE